MTRRRLARQSADPQHKQLMRGWHYSPRGANKAARWKALRDFVAKRLKEEAQQ